MTTTRSTAVLTTIVAALLVLAPTASAHVSLKSSNPAQGTTVTAPLAELSLVFSGPVNGSQVTLTLTGPDGTPVALPGQPASVDATLTQPLPSLANGAHRLAFEVSAGDGHPLTGTVDFTVALPVQETTTPPPAETDPAPETVAQEDDGDDATLWWILAAVMLVAIAVAVVLVRRRRA